MLLVVFDQDLLHFDRQQEQILAYFADKTDISSFSALFLKNSYFHYRQHDISKPLKMYVLLPPNFSPIDARILVVRSLQRSHYLSNNEMQNGAIPYSTNETVAQISFLYFLTLIEFSGFMKQSTFIYDN
ncbi:hypothetical protein D3C86_1882540 [compost metagenome]